MSDALLVTAIADGTGKTAVTIALGLRARERGEAVAYMKPKGTRLRRRVGKTLDEDPMLARELLDFDAEMHEMEPVVYSPTFVEQAVRGQADPDDLREQVQGHFQTLASGRDRVLVEGGGTLTTGGIVDLTDADVAELVDADVLVIASYDEPGDLDDVLAAVDTVGRDRLRGVLFNAVADAAVDSLEEDAVPFLEGRDIPVLGSIPGVQSLAGVTVRNLAEELGADVLTDAPTDGFVERFTVGAMSADSALRHFRRTRDAAVITGGDRSDIHTAALEAPGIRCLILTGGHRPSGAVVGKAEEKGVPIVVVQTDTLTTVERAEAVVSGGRTRDAEAVRTMEKLLGDHADVDAILDAEE